MGFDDRGSGPRGGGGFGRGPPREMHDAVCADCGKATQVPFKPTEGRPVYCRDCYPKHAKPRNPRF
ncbi:MAG TPA: CxxC-x17-CxxC domain-containing protein [Candidatus Thermoplasmatota archaeon]|nr:CxxC-x17-CxxC domain-containing protein [Candidatus Thermoplasmatota archaeon]